MSVQMRFMFLAALSFGVIAVASCQATVAEQKPASKEAFDKPIAELPIEICGDHTLIKLNIKGHDVPLDFVLDSGAGSTVICSRVAKRIGIKSNFQQQATGAGGSKTYDVSTNQSFSIAKDVTCDGVHFVLVDLTELSEGIGREIGGITGFDIFSKYVVKLDHDDKKLLIFGRNANVAMEGFRPLKFQFHCMTIPMVETTFSLPSGDEFKGPTLFDTGAGLGLAINTPFRREKSLLKMAPKSYRTIAKGLNSTNKYDVVKSSSTTFAEHNFGEMELNLANSNEGVMSEKGMMGIIGNKILKRFDIIFDYGRKTLYFKPNRFFYEPFRFNLTGLRTLEKNGKIIIESVVQQSPAQKAGIKSGDQLVSVDGEPTNDVELLRHCFKEPGKQILMIVKRKNDKGVEMELEIKMTLNRML